MKKIVKEHAVLNLEMIRKFQEMEKVISVSCVVADAQERDNVMNSYMKPRSMDKKIIGPAFTVKLTPGDLIDYFEMFKHIKSGDVLVVDANGETETSVLGGLMSGLLKVAGVLGAVVDGAVRDTDEARMVGFPVYSKAVGPRSTHTPGSQRMEPYELNVPIICAGVIVKPGDLIVADEIGITVIPQETFEEVYPKAQKQAAIEEAARKEILEGKTIEELLAKFGRL